MKEDGYHLYDWRINGRTKAATIELCGEYAIFIDTEKINSMAEETCVVAHELGHCETGCTHTLNSPCDLIARHENRANKWAIHHILPAEEIKKAMRDGYTTTWQLAEHFDLTEEFIRLAIKVYQSEELL